MLWIYTLANEMVSLLTGLGMFWNIDGEVVGLTFLAWANSIPDLVANVSFARGGKARTAGAACLGEPLLNLLCGVGIGCTIAIAGGQKEYIELHVSITVFE